MDYIDSTASLSKSKASLLRGSPFGRKMNKYEENRVGFSRGVLQLSGTYVNALAENECFPVRIPPRALEQRRSRDRVNYHLTITNPDELKKDQEGDVLALWEGRGDVLPSWVDEDMYAAYREYYHENLVKDLFPIGDGKCVSNNQCAYYIVVVWPRAYVFRQALGLPEKDFHITLGFDDRDIHAASKGIATLVRSDWMGLCLPQLGDFDVPFHRILQMAENKKCGNSLSSQLLRAAQVALVEIQASINSGNCELNESINLESCVEWQVSFQVTRAKVEGRNKNFDLVLDAAEEILALDATNMEGLGFKAFALLQLGQLEAAYKTVQLFPKSGNEDSKQMKQLVTIAEAVTSKYQSANSKVKVSNCTRHLKYPRTAHLKNLGAATDDDVVKPEAAAHFIKNGLVYIEEKIDGANIGISLGENCEFILQNRGHLVNSSTMAQFSQIESWVDENSASLYKLLSEKDGMVLYGEWCLAQHSVEYRKLPGYFIAFDIWSGEDFLSRGEFHLKMEETRIPVVPIIYKGEVDSEVQLLEMVERTESKFGAVWSRQKSAKAEDFPHLEGLMLRKEEGGRLAHRMKLVRGSFTEGIETHWCKQNLVKNRIDFDFQEEYLNYCYSESENNVAEASFKSTCKHGVSDVPHLAEMPSLNPRHQIKVNISSNEATSSSKHSKRRVDTLETPGKTIEVTMQRNFSFITPEIAVSSTPKDADQVRAMCEAFNIGICLTLTEECPLPQEWFGPSSGGIKNVFVPVPNYHPPTEDQADMILELFKEHILTEQNIPNVLIHCGGGKGRAGTVAACCLLKWGLDSLKKQENHDGVRWEFADSSQVIRYLRHQRPGSIETERQEKFVRSYAQKLWRQVFQNDIEGSGEINEVVLLEEPHGKTSYKIEKSSMKEEPGEKLSLTSQISNNEVQAREAPAAIITTKPSAVTHPAKNKMIDSHVPSWMEDAVDKARKFSLVMLCGFPGCGKSSFGNLAKAKFGEAVKVLTQDEMGKEALERAVSSTWKSIDRTGKTLIVDRCNVRVEDRQKILSLCFDPPASRVLCVYFATPPEVCIKRVKRRLDHPTIPYGRGDNAIKQFVKQLQVPGKETIVPGGKKAKSGNQTWPYTVLTVDDGERKDEDQSLMNEYTANFLKHEDSMKVDFSEIENIIERLAETDVPCIASLLFSSSQEGMNGQQLSEAFLQDVYLIRKSLLSLDNPEIDYALCIVHYSQNKPGFERAVLTKPFNIPIENPERYEGMIRDVFLWNSETWENKKLESGVFERGIVQYGWKLQ